MEPYAAVVATVEFPTVLIGMVKFPNGLEMQAVLLVKRLRFVQRGLILVFHDKSCTVDMSEAAAIPVQVSLVCRTWTSHWAPIQSVPFVGNPALS
jgi:hypothetical protein